MTQIVGGNIIVQVVSIIMKTFLSAKMKSILFCLT